MGVERNIDITAAQRKIISDLLEAYIPDTEVWVYGSRVKWTAKPYSDIDFDPVHAKKQALEKGLTQEQAAMAIISSVCSPKVFAENFKEMDKQLTEKLSNMSKKQKEDLVHTASLFPSEFKDSELREIPRRWGYKDMQNVFEVRDETHDSSKKSKDGYCLVTLRLIVGGKLNLTTGYKISEQDYISVNKRSKVEIGDILITMIGAVGETLLISNKPRFAIKNIGLFKFSQRKELKFFVDQYLKTRVMKSYIEARLSGTTQKYLSLTELRKLPLLLISNELLSKFNALIELIYIQINTTNKKSKCLAKLTLLPKLLAGKIDLSKIKLNEDSRSA